MVRRQELLRPGDLAGNKTKYPLLRYLCCMKRLLILLLPFIIIAGGCDETGKAGKIPVTGTVTIENTLYGSELYYTNGFNFAKAEITSSLATPKPDVTIYFDDTQELFILQTEAGLNGFFLQGEYADETSAKAAFNNLTAHSVSNWEDWANPVRPNQVWLYRSASEHYAKLRIVSVSFTAMDPRDYAECTFEWAYQPDGSKTFPGK